MDKFQIAYWICGSYLRLPGQCGFTHLILLYEKNFFLHFFLKFVTLPNMTHIQLLLNSLFFIIHWQLSRAVFLTVLPMTALLPAPRTLITVLLPRVLWSILATKYIFEGDPNLASLWKFSAITQHDSVLCISWVPDTFVSWQIRHYILITSHCLDTHWHPFPPASLCLELCPYVPERSH